MARHRLTVVISATAALALTILVFAPYLVVPPGGLRVYYGATLIGPLGVGGLAVILLIVVVGELAGVVKQAVVAGGSLVIGAFMIVVSAMWASAVPQGLVVTVADAEWLRYHRWVLVVVSAVVLTAGIWDVTTLQRLFTE